MKNIDHQDPGLSIRTTNIILFAVWMINFTLYAVSLVMLDFKNEYTEECLPQPTSKNRVAHVLFGVFIVIVWFLIIILGSLSVSWVRHHLKMIDNDSNRTSTTNKHRINTFIHTLKTIIIASVVFTFCVMPSVLSLIYYMLFPDHIANRYIPIYLCALIPVDSMVNLILLYFNRGSEFRTLLCNMVRCSHHHLHSSS